MSTIDRKTELIQQLFNAVVNMDEVKAAEISQTVLAEGIDPYEAVTGGLIRGNGKSWRALYKERVFCS